MRTVRGRRKKWGTLHDGRSRLRRRAKALLQTLDDEFVSEGPVQRRTLATAADYLAMAEMYRDCDELQLAHQAETYARTLFRDLRERTPSERRQREADRERDVDQGRDPRPERDRDGHADREP